MLQAFVCKWLLTMGIMAQLRGKDSMVVGIAPDLPKQATICDPFLSSDKEKDSGYSIFNTPGYGDGTGEGYPNNTECIRVLSAPSSGQVVALDFREGFHLEPSAGCKNDYLEIRDGPYGFSPGIKKGDNLARYCGETYPLGGEKILSSGQFMWLRFRSDMTIQHIGVKAVYGFVDEAAVKFDRRRMRCRVAVRLEKTARASSMLLTQDSFPQNYISEKKKNGGEIDCTFDISAPAPAQIFVHFDSVEFKKTKCKEVFFKTYDGFTVEGNDRDEKSKMCTAKEAKMRTSTLNRLVFRLYAVSAIKMPRFTISTTVLTPGPCKKHQFDCGKDQCVAKVLRCDSRKHCPSYKDEKKCPNTANKAPLESGHTETPSGSKKEDKIVPYHYIILGTIGALLCVFILICLFITIRQRRIDLRNRKRDELLRRSSEAQHPYHSQQPSPHSLGRDLHTPSSLEGNRLLEYTATGGGGRNANADTASLGRLNKQNGAVVMGSSGLKGSIGPAVPSSSTAPGSGPTPSLPSSSVFYDPRVVHSSRVGKYLSVPNPPAGAEEEEAALDSPIEPIVGHHSAAGEPEASYGDGRSNQARCKIHGEVYQREASIGSHHSAQIHRSDSAPSKAFFRANSATPPPNRSGANTPNATQHHHHHMMQESPPPHPNYQLTARSHRSDGHYYGPGGGADGPPYHQHPAPEVSYRQSPHYLARMGSAPAPAYSLHNLSSTAISTGVGFRIDDEDNPPCICRRHETLPPMTAPTRDGHPPPVVRQASLGTPRSLRRKVYET